VFRFTRKRGTIKSMHIQRHIKRDIEEKLLTQQKIIVVLGPRQVGKTTLLKEIIAHSKLKTLEVNGDQTPHVDILKSRDLRQLKQFIAGYDCLFIDEAQRVPDIGINLKILHDNLPQLKIIVTGSSVLDLSGQIKEPLTGRTWTYNLYPISILELSKQLTPFELNDSLTDLMLFGSYPELFKIENKDNKITYLEELSSAYLYKDILSIANIKNPDKLKQLLILLAHQIGGEVSYSELGRKLEVSKETVQHYIGLLEKAFVIFSIRGFNRNLRKEVSKMPKIYFYDLGIRNILIGQLQPLNVRTDVGALWENFCISERIKRNSYLREYGNSYFWRTYTGAELDYIEEKDGLLNGYEFKYKKEVKSAPKTWVTEYQNSTFSGVNTHNYLEFLT